MFPWGSRRMALFSTIAGFIDLAEREKQASQPGGKSASSTVKVVEQELQAHTGLPSWGPHKFASHCSPHMSKKTNRLAQTGHKDGRDYFPPRHLFWSYSVVSNSSAVHYLEEFFWVIPKALFFPLPYQIYLHTTLHFFRVLFGVSTSEGRTKFVMGLVRFFLWIQFSIASLS